MYAEGVDPNFSFRPPPHPHAIDFLASSMQYKSRLLKKTLIYYTELQKKKKDWK